MEIHFSPEQLAFNDIGTELPGESRGCHAARRHHRLDSAARRLRDFRLETGASLVERPPAQLS